MESLKDKTRINSYNCDIFIGREVFKDRSEYLVTLDLRDLSSISYRALEDSYRDLCEGIKNNKKVLLNKSPGQVGEETNTVTIDQLNNAIRSITKKTGLIAVMIGQKNMKETCTIQGRRYEPLKPKQTKLMQARYQNDPEMRNFPNPFNN